jgi:hypothetical protein
VANRTQLVVDLSTYIFPCIYSHSFTGPKGDAAEKRIRAETRREIGRNNESSSIAVRDRFSWPGIRMVVSNFGKRCESQEDGHVGISKNVALSLTTPEHIRDGRKQ